MTSIRDHAATVEGVRIHWAEAGEASSKSPVVLIHGLNNSCLTWSKAVHGLASDRRVLMPDLPGHGRSARPDAPYALDWHAHIVARWLATLGLEKLDVIGHSFGGGVAQMLLLECPEQVRRLVLVAAGGLGRGVCLWLRLASLPGVIEYLGQPFMALGTRLALRSPRDGVTPQDILELSRFNAQAGSARAFGRSVRDVIGWRGQRRSFHARAGEIAQLPPLLVLWGDRDPLIPISHARAFAASVEGAAFKVFSGAGHYPYNERPEEFAQVSRAFLDDPAAPAVRLKPPLESRPSRGSPKGSLSSASNTAALTFSHRAES